MESLNYHHLLYFWVVAREGGLAPAGKRLRLSHATLSGQIQKLEEELGLDLFQKRGRRLELTELGRVAYRYAEEIFGLGREMREALRGRAIVRAPRLAVGITSAVPKSVVHRLLAPVLAQGEAVTLVCREDRIDRLLASVALHELDLVLSDVPTPAGSPAKVFNHVLGTSDVTLLAAPALARRLPAELPAGLDGAPVLLPATGGPLRTHLDAWLSTHDVRPRIIAESSDSAVLEDFAADGLGLLFTPTIVADTVAARHHLVPLSRIDAVTERYFAISAERRLLHPTILALRDAARDTLFARR